MRQRIENAHRIAVTKAALFDEPQMNTEVFRSVQEIVHPLWLADAKQLVEGGEAVITAITTAPASASATTTTMPLNFQGKPRPPFLWYRDSPIIENTQSWHTSIESRDDKNPPSSPEDSPLPQFYVHPTTLADLRTFLHPPSLHTGYLDGALLADLLSEDNFNSSSSPPLPLPQRQQERTAELLRILAQHGPQHRVATFDTPTAVTRYGAIINLSQPVGGQEVLQNGGCFADWTLEHNGFGDWTNMIPFKGIDKGVSQFWPAFPRVVTVAVQAGDSNFFHFVANSLAALAVLGEENWGGAGGRGEEGAIVPTVLHVTAKKGFAMQFLDLLGFGKNEVGSPFSKVQVVEGDIRAHQLIVPEPGRCGMMSARQARWLRKTLLQAANATSVERAPTTKVSPSSPDHLLPASTHRFRPADLLILVRRSKTRTVANWPAVVALAESYAVRHNLTIVEHRDDEELPSVAEQIRSFSRAHTVIGPYGAANTLLVVAPVGVRMVEFTSQAFYPPFYPSPHHKKEKCARPRIPRW